MSRFSLGIEQRVLKAMRAQDVPRGRWLLAVSGGLDSTVLAEVIWRWRRLLKLDLRIAHVHHGLTGGAQDAYRQSAQRLVRQWCRERGVDFVTVKPGPSALKSEADLREFRLRTLERWRRKYGCDLIVFAHHRDDLLETRMVRLIRGSGPQGLRSMSFLSGTSLRPLLSLSRMDLEAYARERQLSWIEDPSNSDTLALRNWLRREWLPRLELRQKGALNALARSLESLAPKPEENVQLQDFVGLRRKDIRRVSCQRRQTVVAQYLRTLGVRDYGRAHVEEILKRLETLRGEFVFEMLGFRFRVTPDLVWASRV